ncbi:DUF4232 domain-containing protein [Streptomyces sp.]|uniref:DUF4232 domain-containing protein n=1 Tax=Streptomyces sp. TaxID=1931 RepID=UPI002F957067
MSARTSRTRLLAAATVALAALTLTACGGNDAAGVRDDGAPSASESPAQPGSSGDAGKKTPGGTAGGETPAASGGSKAAGKSGGTSDGKSGSTGSAGTTGKGSGSKSRNRACDGSNTKTSATEVSRPLNHMLLTVTNTGDTNCDLLGYPIARFGEAQAVPPVREDTHPQAVITLAPGKSGYAGVRLSAADGSGADGYTAKTLTVAFENGGPVGHPALDKKGVHVDSSLEVTYWQHTLDEALN